MVFVLTENKELFLKADNESDALLKINISMNDYPVQTAKYLNNKIYLVEANNIISAKMNINHGKILLINNGQFQWTIL